MKNIFRGILNSLGFELKRITPFPAGSPNRPVGSMEKLLEDLKVRGLNCDAIIDVGANVGDWSRLAKKVFSKAKFCLIEPQIEMKAGLKSFCNESPNSTYILAGAASVAEKKYLTVWDDLAGSSFLPVESEELKKSGKQRVIEMITIDDIIKNKQFDIPQLVKLDIQGYELEALKGAELLFGKTDVFILEVSLFSFSDVPGIPVIADVVKFMDERDYVIYDFGGFSRRPFDGALAQCDICFVKRTGQLRASKEWN